MKTKNLVHFFIVVAALAFSSTSATAGIILDFRTGTDAACLASHTGTINYDGTDVSGSDIAICALEVAGVGTADGVYTADAALSFDTATSSLSIFGTVAGLVGSATELLTGVIEGYDYKGPGYVESFEAWGPDTKSCELLRALGICGDVSFQFYGFSIDVEDGRITSTDIVNTQVPVPAAVWLFGSGLLGLVGVARRRKAA